jgi:hypothetical protein
VQPDHGSMLRYHQMITSKYIRAPATKPAVLELPPIGWQLFILDSSQSDSTAFPSCLDTYATRLLTEPLSIREYARVLV